jgi:hypothetical protein
MFSVGAVPLWISADGSILVQTFLNQSLQEGLDFISYLYTNWWFNFVTDFLEQEVDWLLKETPICSSQAVVTFFYNILKVVLVLFGFSLRK